MNDVSDTELLSAYLDGELTADEQVRAERILTASPEARQLLEELRALGCTLQELPQEKLDEDLSTRVLEVAERRMLLPSRLSEDAGDKPSAGRAADSLNQPKADSTGSLGIPWREISWRGMFSKRALIWSGVVVATAIIISFTSPLPPELNRNIAKVDKEPAAVAASGEKRSESSTTDGSWAAPAGQPKKPRADDLLAKDKSCKPADGKEPEKKTEADSVRHGGGEMESKLAMRDGTGFRTKAEERPADDRAGREADKEVFSYGKSGQGGFVPSDEKSKKVAPPIELIAETKPAPVPALKPAEPAPAAPSQSELPMVDAPKSLAEPSPSAIVMSKAPAPSKAPGSRPAKGWAGKGGYEDAD
ncbi:MAG: zf-HC2 domain-containing protein, partial [Planctomycetota bacterium]